MGLSLLINYYIIHYNRYTKNTKKMKITIDMPEEEADTKPAP